MQKYQSIRQSLNRLELALVLHVRQLDGRLTIVISPLSHISHLGTIMSEKDGARKRKTKNKIFAFNNRSTILGIYSSELWFGSRVLAN